MARNKGKKDGVSMNGFDDLINTLNDLGNITNKVGKEALEEGSEIVLKQQKKDAPRDSGDGGKHLKIVKGNSKVSRIGIDHSNWEECKGIYFQNYGFIHYKDGKLVDPHIGWVEESFKKCKDKAEKAIVDKLEKEIDRILK